MAAREAIPYIPVYHRISAYPRISLCIPCIRLTLHIPRYPRISPGCAPWRLEGASHHVAREPGGWPPCGPMAAILSIRVSPHIPVYSVYPPLSLYIPVYPWGGRHGDQEGLAII